MINIIDKKLIDITVEKARKSERKRTNFNFHSDYSDPMNRMLNAMEPGTYVQPHKHENPDKREVFIVLQGTFLIVIFDDNGNITNHAVLNHEKGTYGIEIPERAWHTAIPLEKGSVVYEIKDGPYAQLNDKNFATWAPKEGSEECEEYIKKVIEACI